MPNRSFRCYALNTVLVILGTATWVSSSAQAVDATTMTNKVMAGYQGWFRAPGDRNGNKGWAHLFNAAVPSPGKLAFDTWPDMSELDADEKYAVPGFTYGDGKQAYLYSAQNEKTVLRHFKWMEAYGIDGVWLSQFCGHFPGGNEGRDAATVLTIMKNVQKAATKTGRTWAFMWDMSGLGGGRSKEDVYDIIINQWKKMVDEGVTSDPRYLHHDGKPVLLLWGFFPGRPASQPEYMDPVVDFLLAKGKYQCTLVGGADPNWRAQGTPEFQAMLMRMAALQPWSVGRRLTDPATGYAIQNTSLWAGDIAKCQANHVIFMPVFNSGTHVAGPPPVPPALPAVPRRNGNYLWEQFVAASKTGVISSAFIAMFDEINEGTQIMKIDTHPPLQAPFLTYDGATSDYYLRLVGAGAKLLKAGRPIDPVVPVSPFDPAGTYRIANKVNGRSLNAGQLMNPVPGAGPTEEPAWQLIFDNAGYFNIKDKVTGNLICADPSGRIGMQSDKNQPGLSLWHLEWDGTGFCRIINKITNKALGYDRAVPGNKTVVLSPDGSSDELRWKITEN